MYYICVYVYVFIYIITCPRGETQFLQNQNRKAITAFLKEMLKGT